MTTEMLMLCWAVVLGLVHVVATGQMTVLQKGMGYGLSSRDDPKPLTGVPARVERAFANYMQTFPFFTAAVVMAHLLGRHTWYTVLGAELYLGARVAYVFLYAGGITGVRTLAYLVSIGGIVMVMLGLT